MTPTQALSKAYDTCAQIVKQSARNFYYAFLALPQAERSAIHAVYAFCRLADDAADELAPTEVKRAQLDEYRRTFDRAVTGNASHPVFVALSDTVDRFDIPPDLFHDLLDGLTQDLTVTRYETYEQMESYCYLVASTVGLMCLPIFGAEGDKARQHGIDLGLALQITNILRDVGEDAARGRIYLPQEDLRAHGYTEGELFRGVVNDAFRSLMRQQVERARVLYESGRQLFQYIPEHTRACPELMYRVYERILDLIVEADYNVFSQRIGPGKWEKLRMVGAVWRRTAMSPS